MIAHESHRMQAALLPDRGVVEVAGADARRFINGLLTADIAGVAPGAARYAALLTPQGKIIADCIVAGQTEDNLLLDCPRVIAPALVARLNVYKLRAKLAIADRSDGLGVLAFWDGRPDHEHVFPDPRLAALGWR